jgi:sigma-E factor negative regulatory protein RseB
MLRSLGLVLVLISQSGLGAAAEDEAVGWLQRAANTARTLDYSGVYIQQSGKTLGSYRIAHRINREREQSRLEVLDGRQREVVQNGDEIYCRTLTKDGVRVERRAAWRYFPAMLPEHVETLIQVYSLKLGGRDRVAGRECQILMLDPRDDMRYAYRLWLDAESGLLLKAARLDESGNPLSQTAFTQVNIGGPVTLEDVHPRLARRGSRIMALQAAQEQTQWLVSELPAGFSKQTEMMRSMRDKQARVSHLVFSDGLAVVSVFIEPLSGREPMYGYSVQDVLNLYAAPLDDFQVTAVGEVPPRTLERIVRAVSRRGHD